MARDSSAPDAPTRLDAGPRAAVPAPVADLVDALRAYRNAESSMRGRSRDSMHLGRTDMTALRLMLHAGQAGAPLNAASLARRLEISTAATTVLIDRLEKSGHAERRRSRSDGRAIEIWPTATSDAEVRSTMGVLHERMMSVAGSLTATECAVVQRFLGSLGDAMTDLDLPVRAPSV